MSSPTVTPGFGDESYAAFSASPVAGLPTIGGRFRVAGSKRSRASWTDAAGLSRARFWEPNRGMVRVLTVDMDMPDSETRLAVACMMGRVPLPDAYVVNAGKGTLQASWWLDPFPSRLLSDEDDTTAWLYSRVLESLRLRLHGDPHFTDGRRRNPYCADGQRVMVSSSAHVRSLSSLRSWLEARGAFDDGRRGKSHSRLVAAAWSHVNDGVRGDVIPRDPRPAAVKGSRNSTVFAAAVAAARNGDDPLEAARRVRCSPPLSDREIKSVVKSAERCAMKPAPSVRARTRAHSSTLSDDPSGPSLGAVCAQWGSRGGRANTQGQRDARRRNLALGARSNSLRHAATRDRCLLWLRRYGEAGLRLVAAGGALAGVSVRAIARGLGVSRQTVCRCLSEIASMLATGAVRQRGRRPVGGMAPGVVSSLAYEVARKGGAFGARLRHAGLTLLKPGGRPPDPTSPSCAAVLLMDNAPMPMGVAA